MARVNVGIAPQCLSDQHLFAERVEIIMCLKIYEKRNWKLAHVPNTFTLGKGHISFFSDKAKYLIDRWLAINVECERRSQKRLNGLNIIIPVLNYNDWKPSMEDSNIVRDRISNRLQYPLKAKSGFHKYYGVPIENIVEFSDNIVNSELYHL